MLSFGLLIKLVVNQLANLEISQGASSLALLNRLPNRVSLGHCDSNLHKSEKTQRHKLSLANSTVRLVKDGQHSVTDTA